MNRNLTLRTVCLFLILFFSQKSTLAQIPILEFQPVLESQFDIVDLVNAGDGSMRMFAVRQTGTIQVYNQAFGYLGDFLQVTDVNLNGGERGLLSMAFHPDYESNGYLFVYYTGGANGVLTIARYKRMDADPNKADPNSKVIVLSIPKPLSLNPPYLPDPSHNGGKLNFGADGYLYLATGDGGSGYDVYGNAENGNSLLGKMLRIDVNVIDWPYYSIPPDNPYVNDPNVLDEIWAMGLRNPWRWSFDRLTNDLWLGDVGQLTREEVNFVAHNTPGGYSFGWHCYEGMTPTPNVPPCTSPNYLAPIFDYPTHDRTFGGNSVIGGFVYRGTEYPALAGYYICADFSYRNAWLIKRNDATTAWQVYRQQTVPSSIYTFGEAENGTLYVSGVQGIFKVAVSAPLPAKLISFTLVTGINNNELKWKTAAEINMKEFVLEYSGNGINFSEVARIAASGRNSGAAYSQKHSAPGNQKAYYRLLMRDIGDAITYSKIISTTGKNPQDAFRVYPTISTGQRIQLELNDAFPFIAIYNVYGQMVQRVDTGGGTGMVYLEVQSWPKGTYFVIARNENGQVNKTFTIQ